MNSQAASEAYLRARNVTKQFKDFLALKDVSLDVQPGEFVCFLGPSGCGKTTLLRAIAGLDIQSHGTIHQAGRDISALPPEERDFGIVFQSYALFPNMTVQQNIAFGLENRGMPRKDIDGRVSELLEMIGLPDRGKSYPSQISGGQQQRVALARALAPKPGLILLDEPLSALDAKVRMHLREELKQIQRTLGVTTIMVTHDQEEALSIADRVVVMNVGVIEQVGTPQEIYDNPQTKFVADFIGAMNFAEATVVSPSQVEIKGMNLSCQPHNRPAGERVVAAIRPEDVTLAHANGSTNPIDVQVVQVEFLGSHVRARLKHEAFGDRGLIAQISRADAIQHAMMPGSRTKIDLPVDRIRVFDAVKSHG
ncbi:MAG: putative 2-aminoethylphosphonate ABC transporter ATP-binding protein [Verrucomicrobiaceae bacterium]